MAQIIDPIPNDDKNVLLCCYVNATSQIQVARITNIRNWYFERVVFPGQRLVFESVPEGLLEIHTGMMASAILSDKIPCKTLVINVDPITENQEEPEIVNQNINQSVTENNSSDQATNQKIEYQENLSLKSSYSLNSGFTNIPSFC